MQGHAAHLRRPRRGLPAPLPRDQQAFLDGLLAQQKLGPCAAPPRPPRARAAVCAGGARAAFRSAGTYNTDSLPFIRGVLQHEGAAGDHPAHARHDAGPGAAPGGEARTWRTYHAGRAAGGGALMSTDVERLRGNLKRLGRHAIADLFEREAQKAAKTKQSYVGFLDHLIDEELAQQADRSVNARILRARFPTIKTLEGFQFEFQPSIPAPLIRELAELGFLARAENLVLVGAPGTGKCAACNHLRPAGEGPAAAIA